MTDNEQSNDQADEDGNAVPLPPESLSEDEPHPHRRVEDEPTAVHFAVSDGGGFDEDGEKIGRHSREASSADPIHTARAGSSFRRRSALPTRRGLILVLLLGLVIAGFVIDGRQSETNPLSAPSPVVGAAPASATSSAWYCPMTLATRANPNASSIVVLNPNDSTLSGVVTYFPEGASAVVVPVNVPPRTQISLHPGESVDAPFAAALVRFDGGGAAVEHSVASPNGIAFAPCATQASARWYFAEGATQANSTLQIGLFNPFPEDAIADVNFNTNDGIVAPDEFQGVVVPARSFTSLNVSDRVRRRDWIATTVSARSGRIVASQLQVGSFNAVLGTGLTLGAVAPRDVWYLPDGVNLPGFTDQLTLFNPNDKESEAVVELLTDKGSITPFQLHVPANGRIAVNLDKEDRVPKDASYGSVVRVVNGVDLVVQRTATAASPNPTTGAFTQIGDTDPAKRWIVPLNETRDPFDDWVYIMNASGRQAMITVSGVSPAGQPLSSSGVVQSGRRLLVHVDEFASDGSNPGLVIESDQPVVVGRTLYVNPGIGLSSSIVIPVR